MRRMRSGRSRYRSVKDLYGDGARAPRRCEGWGQSSSRGWPGLTLAEGGTAKQSWYYAVLGANFVAFAYETLHRHGSVCGCAAAPRARVTWTPRGPDGRTRRRSQSPRRISCCKACSSVMMEDTAPNMAHTWQIGSSSKVFAAVGLPMAGCFASSAARLRIAARSS